MRLYAIRSASRQNISNKWVTPFSGGRTDWIQKRGNLHQVGADKVEVVQLKQNEREGTHGYTLSFLGACAA